MDNGPNTLQVIMFGLDASFAVPSFVLSSHGARAKVGYDLAQNN